MKNRNILFTAILVALTCFLSTTWALSPAPDGGYAGQNTAEGDSALLNLNTSTGTNNTAVGWFSLKSDVSGQGNTAIGSAALFFNTASNNTATGLAALFSNTTGTENTADGALALYHNTTGRQNTAIGFEALLSNTINGGNTAIGDQALKVTTSFTNTGIGAGALFNSTTGNGNIALGFNAGLSVVTASGVIAIGASGADVTDSCFIGHIRGVTTQFNDAMPVLIDSQGQLGTTNSSRRYKTDIKPIEKASESILALKPVSFRYKVHKDKTPQFGLIAEDVAKINPNLVIYDADGKPYTVRYEAVNAMLLNEFLKEHRKVEQMQKQIEALTAGLQKVSAQLELSKSAPQTVLNNR